MENQSLADFFSSTDPFHLSDTTFPPAADTKDAAHDYNNWESFIAPATVHRVIPDQTHLQHDFQHGLHTDQTYAHLTTPHHDLQAPPTLFSNLHPFSSAPSQSLQASDNAPKALPMVATSNGLIREQLAALLPNHTEDGTLDAQLAAQWAATSAQRRHEPEFGPFLHRSSLKRTYAFGTDNSFNNPAGYSAPHGHDSESQAARQSMREMRHSRPSLSSVPGVNRSHIGPAGIITLPLALKVDPSDDEQSEEASSEDDDDDDRPAKKRRKSTYRIGKESPRKASRNSKNRKASLAEEGSKKKRPSVSSQKIQRENLSEEQKRSNHILSEQKRRNLIKRGFDDLHDLVPEIRNGGLSKSSVLMEAANFLEKLIQDNNSFWRLAGGLPVTAAG